MNCPNCPSPLIQPEGGYAYCPACGWGKPTPNEFTMKSIVVPPGPVLPYTVLEDEIGENLYAWYPWWHLERYRIEYVDEPGWRWRPRWRLYSPRTGWACRVWWVWS